MTASTDTDTAIVPGTYELRQDDWWRGTSRAERAFPLSDVRITVMISHESGRMEAFVAERPAGCAEPGTVPMLCIGIPIDDWANRYPELYDLLAELLRRRRREVSEPSAIDVVRALLDRLGFTDATPDTAPSETTTA